LTTGVVLLRLAGLAPIGKHPSLPAPWLSILFASLAHSR
jgi:hypothetical protein